MISDLFEVAKKNPSHFKARIVAKIIHKKLSKPIIAANNKKSHPFQKRFAKHPDCIYVHAEISAIHKALKILSVDDLAKAELIIVRAKLNTANEWQLGNSLPCPGCQRAISKFRIKKVWYTTETGYLRFSDSLIPT